MQTIMFPVRSFETSLSPSESVLSFLRVADFSEKDSLVKFDIDANSNW